VRLIEPGATEQDTTRRRASLSEFTLDDPAETRLLRETIDTFIAARLLTANEIAGTTTIEVSHEALIREWPRLGEWMRAVREDIPLQQALSRDVAEWQRRGKPGHRLYRGAQLKESQAWAARNMPSAQEQAFLRASATRRVYTITSIVAVVVLILASLGTAAWFVTHQSPDRTLVTNLHDDGPGSLRWAIQQAPDKSTITFASSLFAPGLRDMITLSSADLVIGKSLTIKGPGKDLLTIRGSSGGHIVRVAPSITVTISGLAFQGDEKGCLKNNFYCPGLIYNEGTLTLLNSSVSGNTAEKGGGIYTIGTLTLTNSTVSGNTASQGDGGGIFTQDELTAMNSTIANNKAVRGGGIAIVGMAYTSGLSPAHATLTFCTLYSNEAHSGADIGIFDNDSQGNLLPQAQQISSVTIQNSIVAGPSAPDIAGRLALQGHNLFLANSGATFDPRTQAQHATDKMVSVQDLSQVFATPAQLGQHGGPTMTLALLPDSSNPAVDTIPLDACQVDDGTGHKIKTDQRMMARSDDGESMCDIGAYES